MMPRFVDEKLDVNWTAVAELGSTLNTLEKALDHAECDFFPNIHTFLCIMRTLPVTSCECERSISMLTEEQERLDGLAMLYYHHDVQITPEEVVDEFSRRHSRRMLLI